MLLQVVCTGPLTCVAQKKVHSIFFDEVRLGGGGVHVSGGRVLHGVSEGGGVI